MTGSFELALSALAEEGILMLEASAAEIFLAA